MPPSRINKKRERQRVRDRKREREGREIDSRQAVKEAKEKEKTQATRNSRELGAELGRELEDSFCEQKMRLFNERKIKIQMNNVEKSYNCKTHIITKIFSSSSRSYTAHSLPQQTLILLITTPSSFPIQTSKPMVFFPSLRPTSSNSYPKQNSCLLSNHFYSPFPSSQYCE